MDIQKKYQLAMDRKIEIVGRYGGRNLSRMLNISHPAVSKWKVIPMGRAFQIEKLGDYKIEYIRPDLNTSLSI
jgi:hypothetical protein